MALDCSSISILLWNINDPLDENTEIKSHQNVQEESAGFVVCLSALNNLKKKIIKKKKSRAFVGPDGSTLDNATCTLVTWLFPWVLVFWMIITILIL